MINLDKNKLVVIDFGALGGLKQAWRGNEHDIVQVLFEPDNEQAEILRQKISHFYQTIINNFALGSVTGRRALYITKSIGCTSVLKPNHSLMSRYSVAPVLDVIAEEYVDIRTYGELFRAGQVPSPDMIKIDVQGFEYEVQLGFGDLLKYCLAVELETHLLPVYEGQKLFNEVNNQLFSYGFSLRRIVPVNHFDGDVVELDAWYTIEAERMNKLGPIEQRKLSLIENEWKLMPRHRQFKSDQWDNERADLGLRSR